MPLSAAPMTIAHLSDIHLAPLRGIGLQHLNLKRALGLANWMLKRRKVHLREVVDKLTADLAAQNADHIIVSGDLTNLGLPGEHAHALGWLGAVGPPGKVSVVPGNHDIYCPLWRDPGVERWRGYMTSDAAGARYATPVERGFPYVRIAGNVALIGLVSAVPTKPFQAIGRLGSAQMSVIGPILDQLARDGFFRLVIIHHPPLAGQADERRHLTDDTQFEQLLMRHGAELVVHGHNHVDMHASRAWPGGTINTVGVASASTGRAHKHEPLGRYNLYRIDGVGRAATIEVITRGLTGPDGPVGELGRRPLIVSDLSGS
jgi:3',5'-cyclic AMP phosphodiesterase CpdA